MRSLKGQRYYLKKATGDIKGVPTTFEVYVVGRTGILSPETWYIEHKGRLYSPFAQKIYGFHLDLNSVFRLTYGTNEKIRDLVYESNPFLRMLKRAEA